MKTINQTQQSGKFQHLSLPHCSPGLAFAKCGSALAQRQTAVIPAGTIRNGRTRSLALPLAIQHGGWLIFAQEQPGRPVQHGCWRWGPPSQHRTPKYGDWRWRAFDQHQRCQKHNRNRSPKMLRNAETDPIWFFLLVAGALCCAGCESAQQVRQNEMAQARAMVRANFGNQLSPEQEAYLTAMLYQRMESDRVFGKPTPLLFAFDLRSLLNILSASIGLCRWQQCAARSFSRLIGRLRAKPARNFSRRTCL